MLTSIAGSDDHPTWDVGDEVHMTVEQARVFADGDRAEVVRTGRKFETPESRRQRPDIPEG